MYLSSTKDIWMKKTLHVVNTMKFSRFCCLFSLRQGTILIAITDLSLTSFCLFLLLLGATHAQDIVALVTSEIRQLEERSLNEAKTEEFPTYIINNEEKMLLGQDLAFIIMFIVWASLLWTSIHFISCILLLYGAIRNISNFLLPWISTALFSLISGCFFLIMLTFVPFQQCKLGVFTVLISLYAMELYAWLVVFSRFREMKF